MHALSPCAPSPLTVAPDRRRVASRARRRAPSVLHVLQFLVPVGGAVLASSSPTHGKALTRWRRLAEYKRARKKRKARKRRRRRYERARTNGKARTRKRTEYERAHTTGKFEAVWF